MSKIDRITIPIVLVESLNKHTIECFSKNRKKNQRSKKPSKRKTLKCSFKNTKAVNACNFLKSSRNFRPKHKSRSAILKMSSMHFVTFDCLVSFSFGFVQNEEAIFVLK